MQFFYPTIFILHFGLLCLCRRPPMASVTSTDLCIDKHNECYRYKRRGYCNTRYRDWMVENCPKICDFCPTSECRNTSPYGSNLCEYWKHIKGYCKPNSVYFGYMSAYCHQSCMCKKNKSTTTKKTKILSTTATTTKTHTTQITKPATKCLDKSKEDCRQWLRLCRKPTVSNPNKWFKYMEENCRRTCSLCSTIETALICGRNKANMISQIVAGSNAPSKTWIWQAALYSFGEFFCGGTLITRRHVLTAAHCVRFRFEAGMTVVLGDYDRSKKDTNKKEIAVEKLVYHNNYDGLTFDNDIAVLTLKEEVMLSDHIGVVCLPTIGDVVQPGTSCFITGWGRTKFNTDVTKILQQAKLSIISTDECSQRNKNTDGVSQVTKNMLCAGHTDYKSEASGCKGDSGGPLVCRSKDGRWVQHGVVSWGSDLCDSQHKYTVFAKTTEYMAWLKRQTAY